MQTIENWDWSKPQTSTNKKKKKIEELTIDQQVSNFEKWLRANIEETKVQISNKIMGVNPPPLTFKRMSSTVSMSSIQEEP